MPAGVRAAPSRGSRRRRVRRRPASRRPVPPPRSAASSRVLLGALRATRSRSARRSRADRRRTARPRRASCRRASRPPSAPGGLLLGLVARRLGVLVGARAFLGGVLARPPRVAWRRSCRPSRGSRRLPAPRTRRPSPRSMRSAACSSRLRCLASLPFERRRRVRGDPATRSARCVSASATSWRAARAVRARRPARAGGCPRRSSARRAGSFRLRASPGGGPCRPRCAAAEMMSSASSAGLA